MWFPPFQFARESSLLLLLSLACTEADRRSGAPADSAGIKIVTSAPPYPARDLADAPDVRIGTVEGSPDHQFTRVVFAAGLSDGTIVVVDAGSNDVRWFARDGTLLVRTGGRGEGPGEFLAPVAGALLSGDTLALFDARSQRLTWLAPDGALVRTRRLEASSAFAVTLGEVGAGRLLVAEESATYHFGGSEYNYARDTLLLMLPSDTGDGVDTISRLPGREAVTWVDYVDGRPAGTRQMELPLGEIALAQAMGESVIIAGPGGGDISFYSLDGTLTRIGRRSDLQLAGVSADLRERYVATYVERADAGGPPAATIRASIEDRLALLPEGRALPAFDRVIVDGERDEIWIREFVPPWMEGQEPLWTVYDRDGHVMAQVELPVGFRPMHVNGAEIVGVQTDRLGIEYVVLYSVN